MAKIYVASSWRNVFYPDVVQRLRDAGHEVYDFRNLLMMRADSTKVMTSFHPIWSQKVSSRDRKSPRIFR